MKHRFIFIILLFVLFFAAWLPRVIALDAFVTPDEPRWLTRSANFYQALSEGDLANTYQREHPGVTVMWAGTLGFLSQLASYPDQTSGPFHPDGAGLEQWLKENNSLLALQLLVAGRWWMALWIALTVPVAFLLLRRLFDSRVALLATFWCAWEPFHIALSRQLHLDGLVSSLIFLSLLSFLIWLYPSTPHGAPSPRSSVGMELREAGWSSVRRRQRHFLLLSAVLMGLGWLTKAPAVVLVPFCALLLLVEWRGNKDSAPTWKPKRRQLVLSFVAWGVMALLTFVALWPALWVAPIATLSKMTHMMQYYASSGHGNGNYFLGQITRDPGMLFYPVHYLYRMTPLTFFGLGMAAVVWWRSKERRIINILVAFALFFTLFISLIAKQNDRYLLPIFLPLDVVAAWGWVALVDWIKEKFAPSLPFAASRRCPELVEGGSLVTSCLLGLLLLLHGVPGLRHAPYYLTYYNPMFGGLTGASSRLTVGWGEGLEQAAAWLNGQAFDKLRAPPVSEMRRVLSWYENGPFSYYFQGQVGSLTEDWNPYSWCDTDMVVTYINQWQRHLPNEEAHHYFSQRTPNQKIELAGLEYARIYDMRDVSLPFYGNDERRADFGGQIRLATYNFEQQEAAPGDRFQAIFNLQSLVPIESNYNILVRLVAADGRELWRDDGWPWGAPTSQWPLCKVREDGHEIVIPDDAPTGIYALTVSFYNPTTLEPLPVTELNQQIATGHSERVITLIEVGTSLMRQPLTPAPQFGSVALLRGITLPDTISASESLKLHLLWESVAHTPLDYTTFVHVVAADGTMITQQDRPPLNGFAPTSLWQPGQTLRDDYTLQLPADLPAGEYTVRVGLYTLEAGRLPVTLDGIAAGDAYETKLRVSDE
ncbi:MAG: phospholipid carrier-dependent glycosyltransferase [Ardenticatenaceae bacterium]